MKDPTLTLAGVLLIETGAISIPRGLLSINIDVGSKTVPTGLPLYLLFWVFNLPRAEAESLVSTFVVGKRTDEELGTLLGCPRISTVIL